MYYDHLLIELKHYLHYLLKYNYLIKALMFHRNHYLIYFYYNYLSLIALYLFLSFLKYLYYLKTS